MHTPPNPIPALPSPAEAIPAAAEASDHQSWTCARCGHLCDPALSIWIRPGRPGKRAKVWHASCPQVAT